MVCIHPGHDLKESQSIFKEFKVVKFKTREYIYKAFLVTNFDSSAVDDAILLKKKNTQCVCLCAAHVPSPVERTWLPERINN